MAAPVLHPTLEPGVVLNRQARVALASVSTLKRPRCFAVGPAGSGKTTLLTRCSHLLQDAGRRVRFLDGGTDPARVPAAEVLLVDDLHLLEADRLAAVLARASDPEAALLVAMRPWPRPDLALDIARCLDREAPPVVLGQVARSDVLAHLDDAGATLAEGCLTHILDATGGVTWLVTHALAAHDERDCAHDPGHTALRRAVEAQVTHRLDTVPEPLRRAVEQLCVDHPEARLPLLTATTAGDTLEHGHAEGLLLRNGEAVPVVRAAARASLPAHRRHELESRLDGADLRVRQALDAWAAGDLDAAASVVESLPPDTEPTSPGTVTGLVASVWAARSMMSTASDVFRAARPLDAADATVALLAHVGAGHADRVPSAPQPAPDGAPSTVQIALELLDRGLRASLEADPPAGALTDLVRAADLHGSADPDRPLPELPAVVTASVALGTGHITTAQQVVDAAVARTPAGAWSRRRLVLWQAWLALQNERPADARASLAAAERLPGTVSPRDTLLLEAVRVGLVRRHDTVAALETAWRDSLERVRHLDVDLYTALPLTTLLTAAARVGDATTLAPQAARLEEILRELGSPPAWATHVWWAGVQQGILLNEPERLAPHARALVAAAPAHPLARVMAHAGGVWMSVLGGKVDADAVEEAARSLAAAGLAWDGARLAGHGSRRTEDRRVVARLLAVARELHRESAPRAEESTRTGAPEATGVLSQREWDVAVLVLQGKTYNEIGASIFISPKTVEHHVAHIRRRLGATSRSDLMAKLRVLVEEDRDASP